MIRIYNSFVWLSREIAIGCGAVSNRYNTGFLKVCNPRRRGRHQLVIRIYGWRCTDRAIEPFARHDVRCAKGPSLLVISMIYSGICGQGKNADTPFATVNPEGQARKGPHMNTIVKRVAVGAGFLLLNALSVLARTQSNPPSPAQTPKRVIPTVRPKKPTPPPDDFDGFTFTDEQKAKIEQIHQAMKLRMDAVVKDDKLNADQKEAMLDGCRRMEHNEVFKALAPEQQKEVRKKMLAWREAARAEYQKKQQSESQPQP